MFSEFQKHSHLRFDRPLRTTRLFHVAALSSSTPCHLEYVLFGEVLGSESGYAGDDDDDEEEVDQTETSTKKKGKRLRRSVGSSNNRRKNKWDNVDSYFEAAKEVITAILEKVKAKSVESTGKSCEQYSVTECTEALESLGDIDGDTFNKFMERIVPSIEWRKAFLAMSEERKRQWLGGL
ncbi:hypothetical protein Dsin_026680 [Dipteronia sinensis]|uniref:Uncharacterized protein n=1 Tax=Dipteronia sinensis TaxID=43782 RepID=A0AAD9ZYD6_9ROSI|nr:hypothetical protein Dsin_026680 [Dipteronia sinensis]